MLMRVSTIGYYDLFISAVFGHAAGGFGNELFVYLVLLTV